MEKLYLEATKTTPEVRFDPYLNVLDIKGESYPENTAEFYKSVFDWLHQYIDDKQDVTIVFNIELMYFNSSTSKVLMDFFDIMDAVATKNTIEVNWIYDTEDEDNLEYGQDFQEDLVNIRFNFISK